MAGATFAVDTGIDASLKLDRHIVAGAPIHSINSGPSMAPVAGRHYAAAELGADTAIVSDTGGTTFDVSLVRGGEIPRTRETWIGPPHHGHITGFPSVDVTSVGAGGGSIARVDDGGLLHVGPHSAGSMPGPACYGRGGTCARLYPMPQVVDPRPLVETRLREVAAQFERRLDALRCEIDRASTGQEKRRLKRQRSVVKRAYRDARKAARAMLHAPIAW